jgi:hypothetical protein
MLRQVYGPANLPGNVSSALVSMHQRGDFVSRQALRAGYMIRVSHAAGP